MAADTTVVDTLPPENNLNPIAERWERHFGAFLHRVDGKLSGSAPAARYSRTLPEAYRTLTPPALAVRDLLKLMRVCNSDEDALELWRPRREDADGRYLLRLYSRHERFLDELLPQLEALGLRVADQIRFPLAIDGERLFLTSFSVEAASPVALPLSKLKRPLLDALQALLLRRVDSDALNGLLLTTGLSWREIDVFRGYRNYYFQLGARLPLQRFHQALLNNPGIARLLYRYFETRFNPEPALGGSQRREEEALPDLRMELANALAGVSESVDDRILRDVFNLIDSTMRTSYFQRRDADDYFFAFKIGSLGVLNMPMPKPLYEIYVHAADMQGIHLRGAKIARGGIRWSDRLDDFRSEILDLMRTQMVKNALIVPHGAKGGFIVKTAAGRPSGAAVKQAYSTLVRGLLELTDNIADGTVERPPGLVTYDDDDPYLVVAADRGTAGLSDVANTIAQQRRFWLQDAFASGGSRGYDHKRLGITARGGFECVRRHFLELGTDIATTGFSVVGIGSMDGDVFGNAMLLSDKIRLLAAFGSRHIFLDPDPDPQTAFHERRRLFELSGSTWDHYDRRLISDGGGVFARSAKDIPLSRRLRDWLGVRFASVDGESLIRLLLTAPVDLLWLGGIGTYVKASGESNETVGDRGNDGVRVDACQVKARIVGEGANLGFTQKARIEYALAGGRINVDAVDNSAGVDLSDHEVNLKILMGLPDPKGETTTLERRDFCLTQLTDDVCAAVIEHNLTQSLSISLDELRCAADAEPFLEMADRLENAGLLDRAGQSFPRRKDVLARATQTLVRPELAVLMLHGKLALKRALLERPDFLASEFLFRWLADYFPPSLCAQFRPQIAAHPLAREIAATMIVNAVIDQAGSGFPMLADEFEPEPIIDAVGAYLAFDALLDGQSLRPMLRSLTQAVDQRYAALLQLENLLLDYCRWALATGRPFRPTPPFIAAWRRMLVDYVVHRLDGLPGADRSSRQVRISDLEALGMPPSQAGLMGMIDRLDDFPVLADLAERTGVGIIQAASSHEDIDRLLAIADLERRLAQLPARDFWGGRLHQRLRARFRLNWARLTLAHIASGSADAIALIHRGSGRRRLPHYLRLLRELRQANPASIVPYAALSAELDELVEACLSPDAQS